MAYSDEVLADAPLAYYRLNDAGGYGTGDVPMADSSGNARHGIQNNVSVAGLLTGDADTAMTSGLGTVPAAAWMAPLSGLTLEVWAKPATSHTGALIGRSAAGTFGFPGAGSYRVYYNNGSLVFQVFNDAYQPMFTITTAAICPPGATYHIVATWDGTTGYLYVNGRKAAQAVSGVQTMAPLGTLPFNIGSMNGEIQFNGVLDEAAVYDHALTPARVAAHYTTGSGNPVPPTNRDSLFLWGEAGGTSTGDGSYSMGVEFDVSEPREVKALRFYQVNAEVTGEVKGTLFQVSGPIQLFAPVTMNTASVTGWVETPLAERPLLEPGVRYMVVLHFPNRYPYLAGAYSSERVSGPLRAFSHATATAGQSRFQGSASLVFPDPSGNGASYGIDLVVGPVDTEPEPVTLGVWDGSGVDPAFVLGVWDGVSVVSVDVLGAWDGGNVDPLA